MRNGLFISRGDEDFHRSLIEADPEIGYKDDRWIYDLFHRKELTLIEVIEMPANNLALVIEKAVKKLPNQCFSFLSMVFQGATVLAANLLT